MAIYDNILAGTDQINYSRPGTILWSRTFSGDEFTVRAAGVGDQGFYRPAGSPDDWSRPDHILYQQINIVDITEPFEQTLEEIYWLGIHVDWNEGIQNPVGWKTSLQHFEDDAVWFNDEAGIWIPLTDPDPSSPNYGQTLDLAFVITPEPATLGLLLAGGLLALRRRSG